MKPQSIELIQVLQRGRIRNPLLTAIKDAMKTAKVIPDETYPEMHRVLWPDGKQSDMTNLTRANDAAARFNESLDREFRGREKPSEAPYVRSKVGRAA